MIHTIFNVLLQNVFQMNIHREMLEYKLLLTHYVCIYCLCNVKWKRMILTEQYFTGYMKYKQFQTASIEFLIIKTTKNERKQHLKYWNNGIWPETRMFSFSIIHLNMNVNVYFSAFAVKLFNNIWRDIINKRWIIILHVKTGDHATFSTLLWN